MPLAADLRTVEEGGDGPHRGFLKLIASLIECDFDDLWRRERRRKIQRWVASTLVGGTLVGASIGWFQDEQSREFAAASRTSVDSQRWAQATRLGVLAVQRCILPSTCTDARFALARAAGASTKARVAEPDVVHIGLTSSMDDARFDRDGARFATASSDGRARLWDSASLAQRCSPMEHPDAVEQVRFSPDGRLLAAVVRDLSFLGGIMPGVDHKNADAVYLWNAATCKPAAARLPHGDLILSAEFNADGSRLVTASADRSAQVWNTVSGAALGPPMRHDGSVRAAHFNPDGTLVVTASFDKTVRVWRVGEGGASTMFAATEKAIVADARFSPDGRQILYVTGNEAKLVQLGGSDTTRLAHPAEVLAALFDPKGVRIATLCADHSVRIWDAARGIPVGPPMDIGNVPRQASFSPDGMRIVTIGDDPPGPVRPDTLPSLDARKARVWDVATGRLLAELLHPKEVRSAEFSPDGQAVLTASGDKDARLWDASWAAESRSSTLIARACSDLIRRSEDAVSRDDVRDVTLLRASGVRRVVCKRENVTSGGADALSATTAKLRGFAMLASALREYREGAPQTRDSVRRRLSQSRGDQVLTGMPVRWRGGVP